MRGGATVIRRTSGPGRRPVGADAAPGGPAGKLATGAAPGAVPGVVPAAAGASAQGCQVRRTGEAARAEGAAGLPGWVVWVGLVPAKRALAPPAARPVAKPAANALPGAEPRAAVSAGAVEPVAATPAIAAGVAAEAEAVGAVEAPKLRTALAGVMARRQMRVSPPTAATGAATGLPAGRMVCGAPNPVAKVRLASVPCAVARRIVISSGIARSAPAIPGLATWAPSRLDGYVERRTVATGDEAAAAGVAAGVAVAVDAAGLIGPSGRAGLAGVVADPDAAEAAAGLRAPAGAVVGAPGPAGLLALAAPALAGALVGGVFAGVFGAGVLAVGAAVAASRLMVGAAGPPDAAESGAMRTTGAGTERRTSVAGRTSVALRHSRRRPGWPGVAGVDGVAGFAGAPVLVLVPVGGASATVPALGPVADSPLGGVGDPDVDLVTGAVPTADGSRRTTGSAERAADGVAVSGVAVGLEAVGFVGGGLFAVLAPGRSAGAGAGAGAGTAFDVAGIDVGLDDGAAVGAAAGEEPAAVRRTVPGRSELTPAAWRITRLPADQACRRTVAGASTPPAIRLGPAAATTSGLRTDDSSEAGRRGALSAGRARPGVANRETMLASPTGAAAVATPVAEAGAAVEAEAGTEPATACAACPTGVRRTRPSNRD